MWVAWVLRAEGRLGCMRRVYAVDPNSVDYVSVNRWWRRGKVCRGRSPFVVVCGKPLHGP